MGCESVLSLVAHLVDCLCLLSSLVCFRQMFLDSILVSFLSENIKRTSLCKTSCQLQGSCVAKTTFPTLSGERLKKTVTSKTPMFACIAPFVTRGPRKLEFAGSFGLQIYLT